MISFMLAMDRNRLIGANNSMPWYLPRDWAYFKKTTMGHSVLMGRKTYESIGRFLSGRRNIILTRQENIALPNSAAEPVEVRHSLDDALNEFSKNTELFVIGGAEVFASAMPFADRLYVTFIDHEFKGDAYFPEINTEEWTITSKVAGVKDDKNPYDYDFLIYDRKH